MSDLKVIDGGKPPAAQPAKSRTSRAAKRAPTMLSLEPHLCEAERLAAVVAECHVSRLAGNEIHHLPDDQYYCMLETLLDKLLAETKTARKLFYAAVHHDQAVRS